MGVLGSDFFFFDHIVLLDLFDSFKYLHFLKQ